MDNLAAFDVNNFLKYAPHWQSALLYFPTIGSTNQEARRLLQQPTGPRELLLLTDKQTSGRGRLNRRWEAPFGTGLLCTLTLPLAPLSLDQAYLYTAIVALSLKKAAEQEADQTLQLKWPNDLLRTGLKCCGILAELEQVKNKFWLAIGFGLNTGLTERDLTEAGLSDKATNVTPEAATISREAMLAATLGFLAEYRLRLTTEAEVVRQEWVTSLITLGEMVQVLDMDGQLRLKGRAVGVDPAGGLLVELSAGETRLVQAGDVSVRLANGHYA